MCHGYKFIKLEVEEIKASYFLVTEMEEIRMFNVYHVLVIE